MRPSFILFESVKKTIAGLLKMRKPVVIDLKDCTFDAVRGGGPGGQAVAKTSNMSVIFHRPSGITVKNHETRSLEINRKRALKSLERQLDVIVNGDCSLEKIEALKIRAKKQVKANKSKKKHSNRAQDDKDVV